VTRALNVVLGVIVVVLVAWLITFAVRGSVAAPGRTPAEERAHELTELRQAARDEAVAFLTIDYRNMDRVTDRVLAGATGAFKKQYQSSAKVLKETAVSQDSVAKGYVKEIGIGTFDSDSATVFVSAGSKVKNKGTEGKVEDRTWRMRFDMSQVGDRWLVSQLEFVS
jgi:Mce-associated membrane protein